MRWRGIWRPSTLHVEDVWSLGHRAVWGSYFEPKTNRWGYACCKGLRRQEACELQQQVEEQGSSEEEAEEKEKQKAWEEEKLLEQELVVEPELKGSFEDFLSQFVLSLVEPTHGIGDYMISCMEFIFE